jgi:addiction module RelE/StbE family toxin
MKVVWTQAAIADFDNAYSYIAEDSPGAAARTVGRIEEAMRALQRHPTMGRPGRVAETRELVISGTPFIAAYYITAKRIEVVALIHGARRWPDEL